MRSIHQAIRTRSQSKIQMAADTAARNSVNVLLFPTISKIIYVLKGFRISKHLFIYLPIFLNFFL